MTKFRIGGITECMMLALLLAFSYTGFAVILHLPLIHSDISPVFATFCLGIPLSFIGLCLLELFWFERDLKWNGRKRK